MDLVVDTNVLIAATLKPDPNRRLILTKRFNLYAPLFALSELSTYQDEFIAKTNLPADTYSKLLQRVLACVELIPASDYLSYAQVAKSVTPDDSDWPFFAVALMKNCGIWSYEEKLKRQTAIPVYSTVDLLDLF